LNAGMSYTGREVSGSGTMTFAAETSKTAAITFDVPFPTGVVPSVVVSVEDALGTWRSHPKNPTNAGFTMSIIENASVARTGSVNYHWVAKER
jgi:hypothetical protein